MLLLAKLNKETKEKIKEKTQDVLKTAAMVPVAIVGIPVILAASAVAAPFVVAYLMIFPPRLF